MASARAPPAPATSSRRVTTVSRLTAPTAMSVASTTRDVTKPIAAVWLTRFVTGYRATAVPTQAAAVTSSSQAPHRRDALLPTPLMYRSGWLMTSANSVSWGREAANVMRYSTPPASEILLIGSLGRAGCGRPGSPV